MHVIDSHVWSATWFFQGFVCAAEWWLMMQVIVSTLHSLVTYPLICTDFYFIVIIIFFFRYLLCLIVESLIILCKSVYEEQTLNNKVMLKRSSTFGTHQDFYCSVKIIIYIHWRGKKNQSTSKKSFMYIQKKTQEVAFS